MVTPAAIPTRESIPFNSATGQYDLSALFGSDHPIEIEIGCGRGTFLAQAAEIFPDRNYIGIDRVMKWMRMGQKKRIHRSLSNLFYFKEEVRQFLTSIAPESIAVFHVYFPDPWPKRRHRKRRIVTADFLALLSTRLISDGLIELATDDQDYFAQMKFAAQCTKVFWRQVRESINQRIRYESIKTNYEKKFARLGRPLHYLELQKS